MTSPPHRFQNYLVLSLIVLSLVALLWPVLTMPLDRDEGEYALAADMLMKGGLPYQDIFLQKPPGIILIYWGIFVLWGKSTATLHCVLLITYLITSLLLFRIGEKIRDTQTGLWAAALFALSLTRPFYEATSANTEAFMILPLTAAMNCLWEFSKRKNNRLQAALLGLLFGLAIYIKQVALYHGLHMVISLWILGNKNKTQRDWLVPCLFMVFAALPYALSLITYVLLGALRPFLDCILFHNLEYISGGLEPRGFHSALRLHWPNWFEMTTWAIAIIAICTPMRFKPGAWLRWYLGGWLAAAILGLSSGGYLRGHYFIQALPVICIAAGWGLSCWMQSKNRWALPALGTILLMSGPPWLFGRTPEHLSVERYRTTTFVNAASIGARLKKAGCKTLYVLGSEPEIYFYSGCRPISRYVISMPLFGGFKTSLHRQREVVYALNKEKPQYVITVAPSHSIPMFPDSERFLSDYVYALIHKHYRLAAYTQGFDLQIFDAEANPPKNDMALELLVYKRQKF